MPQKTELVAKTEVKVADHVHTKTAYKWRHNYYLSSRREWGSVSFTP